jgi:hypothetical protein
MIRSRLSGTAFAFDRNDPCRCAEMCRTAVSGELEQCLTNHDLVPIRRGLPGSPFPLASASTAATVAAMSLTAATSRAEPLLHVEAGAYLTLTFGDRVDVGYGLRAHAWKEAGLPVRMSCFSIFGLLERRTTQPWRL